MIHYYALITLITPRHLCSLTQALATTILSTIKLETPSSPQDSDRFLGPMASAAQGVDQLDQATLVGLGYGILKDLANGVDDCIGHFLNVLFKRLPETDICCWCFFCYIL